MTPFHAVRQPERILTDREDRSHTVIGAAQLCPQPDQKFVQAKRLGQLVVGPSIKSAHDIRLIARDCHDDNQHFVTQPPPFRFCIGTSAQ
jgi:hypothetical protein